MTPQEAKENQDRIAREYRLEWWYGTNCKKCCGVYPKFIIEYKGFDSNCRYECEVCGTTTEICSMPWVAEKEWNEGKFVEGEVRLF